MNHLARKGINWRALGTTAIAVVLLLVAVAWFFTIAAA